MDSRMVLAIGTVVVVLLILLILNYFSLFRTKKYSLVFQGHTREYLVHLPSGQDISQKYPLVVALHGFGDHPRLLEQYSGLSRKADKEKFIVVYPYGSRSDLNKKLSWNGGSCCGEAAIKNLNDVGFINHLINNLSAKYKVDSDRIYLTGFSNGALLAYRVAAETPDKFAAVAIISGSTGGKTQNNDPYEIPNPKKPMPILIMHGKNDDLINYSGGLNKPGNASFTSFKKSSLLWIENNKVHDKRVTDNDKFLHENYSKTPGGAPVELYTLKQSGHAWFGSVMEIKNNLTRKSVSATEIMWTFFKNNPKIN